MTMSFAPRQAADRNATARSDPLGPHPAYRLKVEETAAPCGLTQNLFEWMIEGS
jgi:hypothetical protein